MGCGTFGRVDLVWSESRKKHFAMKKFSIHEVVQQNRVEYVKREKQLLFLCRSPFIVELICTGMDKVNLILVMEFVHAGELIDYVHDLSGEDLQSAVRFYSMEIVCALQYIHSKDIVYRDLKPENLLLSKDGHIKIADFGLAKLLKGKTYTICGTAEYMAPEVLQKKGYGTAVDWWSFGVLIYELLCGEPPFSGDSAEDVFEAVLRGDTNFPPSIVGPARHVITSLLDKDPMRRAVNIASQEWFDGFEWDRVKSLSIQPPVVPPPFIVEDLSPLSEDANVEASPQRERDYFADWCEFRSEPAV